MFNIPTGIVTQYLIYIMIVELIILFSLIFLIIGKRIWLSFHKKKVEKNKEQIAQILLDSLEHPDKPSPKNQLKKFAFQEILLSQMEKFDRRFKGLDWERLKNEISPSSLLPRARKWVKSRFWIKRNFAARCFALTPCHEDEKSILFLLDDPVFLVSSMASLAAIKLELKEAVSKIIYKMSQAKGYVRFFYRDILLQSNSSQIFSWIKEIAEKDQREPIHLTCLDLLSGITMVMPHAFLEKDLHSENPDIRLAAIKVFAHNPQVDSSQILLKYLDDPNEKIRAQSAFGLKHFATPEAIKQLTDSLKDPSWDVRLEAAKSLKAMERTDILTKLDPKTQKEAFDAAYYAFHFW